jgi:hypothetical protein
MKMAVKESISKPSYKNHFQKNNLSYRAKYIIANVNLSKCRSGIGKLNNPAKRMV